MMMGLRLVREGVADEEFQARFGLPLEQAFGKQIDRLLRLGLLEWSGADGRLLRLTSQGRLLGNQVFMGLFKPERGACRQNSQCFSGSPCGSPLRAFAAPGRSGDCGLV
jgi:hypothetical protein